MDASVREEGSALDGLTSPQREEKTGAMGLDGVQESALGAAGEDDWREILSPRISTARRRWQAFSGSRAIRRWLSTSWDLAAKQQRRRRSIPRSEAEVEYSGKLVAARGMHSLLMQPTHKTNNWTTERDSNSVFGLETTS